MLVQTAAPWCTTEPAADVLYVLALLLWLLSSGGIYSSLVDMA